MKITQLTQTSSNVNHHQLFPIITHAFVAEINFLSVCNIGYAKVFVDSLKD